MTLHARTLPFTCCLIAVVFVAGLVAGCVGGAERPDDWRGAELTGRLLTRNGRPVAQAQAYAYPADGSVLGPAEAMSDPSADDGRYSLTVPPGRYAIVARRRLSGASGGPLRNGDLVGRLDEPVSLDRSTVMVRDIALDIFTQGQEGDPRKVLVTGTRITGFVTTADDRPVEGAHAFAYRDSASSDAPDCISAATGPEGGFVLSLPSGGRYVVGARTGLRGRPRHEDLVGYWQNRDTAHEVADGEVIEGVVIRLEAYRERPLFKPQEAGEEGRQ